MKNNLIGKNIIITGAARGLGLNITEKMWHCGANLLLVGRSKNALANLKNKLDRKARSNQNVYIQSVDLSIPDSSDTILREAEQIWKKLDGLVNNAGIIGPIGPVWENDWSLWKKTIQVNLISPVSLCRACIRWMKETGGGKIINLSGGGATSLRPNFTAYAIAKTGIVRFTEILAEETKDFNIQVNSIAPGALNTDMLEEVLRENPAKVGKNEYRNAMEQKKNGGVSPEKAANLCIFLTSDESDGITGKLISAVWDPWIEFPERLDDIKGTDIYTLRRIIPKERGKDWG